MGSRKKLTLEVLFEPRLRHRVRIYVRARKRAMGSVLGLLLLQYSRDLAPGPGGSAAGTPGCAGSSLSSSPWEACFYQLTLHGCSQDSHWSREERGVSGPYCAVLAFGCNERPRKGVLSVI